MTVYYATFAAVGYLLILAQLTRVRQDGDATSYVDTNTSRLFLFLSCAILALVAGLRWRVGTDYVTYAMGYHPTWSEFVSKLTSFDEPGLEGVALVSSWIHDDYSTMFLLAALITVGLMLWTIVKHSPAAAFSVALYVLAGAWIGSFNGIRQFLACAILFAGHRHVIDRKPIRYLIVVMAAGLFHISALVGVALYFVPRRRLSLLGLAVFVGVSLATVFATDGLLEVIGSLKGRSVVSSYATTDINPLRVAVAVTPALLYGLDRGGSEAPEDWFYRNLAIVHAAVMVAVSGSAYLGRFGIYTGAFLPLYMPRLVKFENSRLTSLVRAAVLALFAVYWYLSVAPMPNLNNFRWIFQRGPL